MQNLELDKQFHIPSREQDNYYHEYCRLYLANVVLTNQVRELIEEKNQLQARVNRLEDDDNYSSYDQNNPKGKRFRRTAHEIDRFYKCVIKSCQKSYGSQGSLNQHYKLKHPQIYVTLPSVVQTSNPSECQFNCLQSIHQEAKNEKPFVKYHSQVKYLNQDDQLSFGQGKKRQAKRQTVKQSQNEKPCYPKGKRTAR